MATEISILNNVATGKKTKLLKLLNGAEMSEKNTKKVFKMRMHEQQMSSQSNFTISKHCRKFSSVPECRRFNTANTSNHKISQHTCMKSFSRPFFLLAASAFVSSPLTVSALWQEGHFECKNPRSINPKRFDLRNITKLGGTWKGLNTKQKTRYSLLPSPSRQKQRLNVLQITRYMQRGGQTSSVITPSPLPNRRQR